MLLLLLTLVAVWARAEAAVAPTEADLTLRPGESQTIAKTVSVDVLPKLDFVLDVDLSGSYSDDLLTIKSVAPDLFDKVRERAPDSQFGLVTYVDFPFSPWGSAPLDYAYRRDQALTSDKKTWVDAVNAMITRSGSDGPESQYESLFQAATGAGKEMPPTTNGDFSDLGEIEPGQGAGFRPDAARVLAITTDASFHNKGDGGGPFPYPGASRDEVVNALNAAGIRVIAIKAPGSGSEMDDIAAATGGVVTTTDAASTEIADAILTALDNLRFTITANPVGCGPLEVSFNPASHSGVRRGASVQFQETVSLPSGATLPAGGVTCTVQFKAGDAVVGTQTLRVRSPASAARRDRTKPRVIVAGVARKGCVRRAFSAKFRIREGNLRRVTVFLNGRRIARTSRKLFSVRVPANRMRAGRHRLRVVAVDRAGNRRSLTRVFARCAQRRAPTFTG